MADGEPTTPGDEEGGPETRDPPERAVRPEGLDPLEELYRRCYDAMVRLAAVLLDDDHAAEDVTQEAFLAVDRRLAGVEPAARPAYLRRAVMNGARSRARRAGRVKRRPVPLRVVQDSPEDVAVRGGETARVLDAVRALPDRQRECVVLRYHADLRDREIAETLGISEGTVKTHLHRAMAALERELDETAGAADPGDGSGPDQGAAS